MQLLGARHPHVLGSAEVLQDDDYLFSIMPYCSGGDLFGVVVAYAEESGGDGGMSEPIARYWFRQILQVSSCMCLSTALFIYIALDCLLLTSASFQYPLLLRRDCITYSQWVSATATCLSKTFW